MRFCFSLALLTAIGLSGAASAQGLAAECPELMDPDAFPDRLSFLAPLNADENSSWILRGSDERTDFGFSDEGLALLGEIVRMLNERYGTTLVTVIPPPRGLFAPHAAERAAIDASYQTLLDEMRAVGVIVPDIMSQVAETDGGVESFYFKTDTHWTPAGAMMAARATAAALADAGLYRGQPEGSSYLMGDTAEVMEHSGTIIRAVSTICGIDLPPEEIEVFPVLPVPENDAADALFGDVEPANQFVLVGTSFSNLSETDRLRWGDGLRLALQADVTNRGVGGGSFAGAFNAYAETDLAQDRPDVLIWEFLHAYVWQSTSVQLRDMLSSAIGNCSAEVSESLVSITDDDWVQVDKLPEGHDIVQLTLPGVDLGTVSFAADHASGAQSRARVLRNERVGADERSEDWSFFAGEYTEDGFAATGADLRLKVSGVELPAVGVLRTCAAADATR